VAEVDGYVYEHLSGKNWSAWYNKSTNSFYAVRDEKIDGKMRRIYMQREIIGLTFGDKRIADHKNANTLCNLGSNLRIATRQGNSANSITKKKDGGLKGTSLLPSGMFLSRIMVNRKFIRLGVFAEEMDAHKAYCVAAKHYFGQFACDGKRAA
jgi:hypothetical protein